MVNERRNFGTENVNKDIQTAIRNTLKRFQDGYSKRALSSLPNFIDELISEESDSLVVGTGDGEWCMGKEEIKELLQIDWEYWGDFILDIDDAIISSYGDVAWVTTNAVLHKKIKYDTLYNNCINKVNTMLSGEESSKDKLVHMLKTISGCLYEGNFEDEVIRPIRFTGVLIYKDGTWKFHNIHFSYPVAPPTDYRIINGMKVI